ncbi:restriction endonuclease subunit S [Microcoleus sp. BROC3]|uniref:restriction endonuclease subunit S n=1 Tax=Microcoleus sp. BROC3 TaxID=3055323 RepID=UPI002FD5E2F5
MDFKTFLENFDAIAEAPGGIPKLRSLILEMAVRGKLVPQNPEDREAKFDIDDIRNRVKKLQKEGRIRKQQKALPLSEELPYRIPIKWNWVRFVDVASIESNLVKPDDFSHYPHIAPNHIEKDTGKLLQYQTVLADEVTSAKHRFFPGQLIYSKIRPNLNKVVLVDFEGLCSADMYPISTGLYPRYLLLYMLSQTFLIQVTSSDNRLAMPKVNQDQLSQILIAVPPIVEQKRIVEKVDELMGLCDRYEAAKQTRDNLRQKLRGSAIASLMNAETDEELDAAWAFVRDNWQNLSQHSGDVSSLRQSILNLAIRGNLVCQQSEDEPAHKIFKEIQESKQLLYSNKKATKKKECLPFNDKEIPFSIPKTWKWVRLHELCWLISDGTHHTPTYVGSGVPFLSVKNVSGGCLDFSNTRFITREAHEELCVRCKPEYGDILLTKVGTTGIAVEIDTHQEFSIFVSIALLKHFPEFTYPRFLQYLLNSSFVKAQSEAGTEGVGNKNLVLRKIYNFIVPLPPLAEQKRIVAKVDELMKLCDHLEASLRQSQQRAESLAASAISHLTI